MILIDLSFISAMIIEWVREESVTYKYSAICSYISLKLSTTLTSTHPVLLFAMQMPDFKLELKIRVWVLQSWVLHPVCYVRVLVVSPRRQLVQILFDILRRPGDIHCLHCFWILLLISECVAKGKCLQQRRLSVNTQISADWLSVTYIVTWVLL